MKEETIKVVLVEDEPFWKENISKYINKESDIEVVTVVDTKEGAIEAAEKLNVDVFLLDLNLTRANLDGIEVISSLSQNGRKVIALTAMKEEEIIIESFEKGVVNFINKSNVTDIIRAIREAHLNQVYIHPDGSSILRKGFIKERTLNTLTTVEREVYELKAKGFNRMQIAQHLNKSVCTIKNQVRSIKDKLKEKGLKF